MCHLKPAPYSNVFCSQIKIGETIISSTSLGVDIPALNVEKDARSEDVSQTLSKLKSIKQFGLTISKKASATLPCHSSQIHRSSGRTRVNYAENSEDDESDSNGDDDVEYVPEAQDDSDLDDYKDWEDDEFVKDKTSREPKIICQKRADLKEIHLESSPVFLCRKCRTEFRTVTELKEHVNSPEPCIDKNLICNKCQKVCENMFEKRRHMRTHIVREKYVCDKCGKEYLHISSLENHKSMQHGEYIKADELQRFKCRDCPKMFNNRTDLFAHSKEHDANQTFLCDICGKCWNNRHNLVNHRRSHMNIKPHACKLCPKSYRTKILLRQHLHVHTGIKEFVCDLCDRRFAKRQSLRYHYTKEHGRDSSTIPKEALDPGRVESDLESPKDATQEMEITETMPLNVTD